MPAVKPPAKATTTAAAAKRTTTPPPAAVKVKGAPRVALESVNTNFCLLGEDGAKFHDAMVSNSKIVVRTEDKEGNLGGDWHAVPNSRCQVCLNLKCNCLDKVQTHQDPTKMKKALQNVAWNTPFGRKKLKEQLSGFQEAETAARNVIDHEASEARTKIATQKAVEMDIVEVFADEHARRDDIGDEEVAGATAVFIQFGFMKSIVSLEDAQRTLRLQHTSEEDTTRAKLKKFERFRFEAAHNETNERQNRSSVESQASVAWAHLMDFEKNHKDNYGTMKNERMSLEHDEDRARSDLTTDEGEGRDNLRDCMMANEQRVAANVAARAAMEQAFMDSVEELEADEDHCRRGLARRMEAHEVDVARWVDTKANQRRDMVAAAEMGCTDIRHCEIECRAALRSLMEEIETAVATWIEEKKAQRAEMLQESMDARHELSQREIDAYFDLQQEMAAHADSIKNRASRFAADRDTFVREALQQLSATRDAELDARREITVQRADEAIAVQKWIEEKAMFRVQFVASESTVRRDIIGEEADALKAFYVAMEHGEAGVHEWIAVKAQERADFCCNAEDAVSQLQADAHKEFDGIFARFNASLDSVAAFVAFKAEQIADMNANEEMTRSDIVMEEAAALQFVMEMVESNEASAALATRIREQKELFDAEISARHAVCTAAARDMDALVQMERANSHALTEEAQTQLQFAREEFMGHEACARTVLSSDEERALASLSHQASVEYSQAFAAQEARLEEERRANMVLLTEDPRLLDDLVDEEFMRATIHDFRRSVVLADPAEMDRQYLQSISKIDYSTLPTQELAVGVQMWQIVLAKGDAFVQARAAREKKLALLTRTEDKKAGQSRHSKALKAELKTRFANETETKLRQEKSDKELRARDLENRKASEARAKDSAKRLKQKTEEVELLKDHIRGKKI